jgi:cell division protein FtsW
MTTIITRPKVKTDFTLIAITVFLLILGLLTIFDATPIAAFRDFNDKLYYFKNQLLWATIGSMALVFLSFFDYHKLVKLAPLLFGGALMLLVAVLIPGIGTKIYGARRWINIAGLTFQPSEAAKLALIFYETSIISKFESYKIRLNDAIMVIFIPAIIATALVVLEPDLGTALIFIGVTAAMYFVGKSPIKHFLIAIPVVLGATALAIFSSAYRLSRVESFLDPTHDPQGASYQIYQILIALKTGGFFGVGLGASQSKFDFIPEVQADAIFAIIVEEFGFIGAVVLIGAFLILISRCIKISQGAPDIQGKILGTGITSLIAIQSLFNLASNVALVPLTGIPLPFISHGGSSLFIIMAGIGIMLNIKKQS